MRRGMKNGIILVVLIFICSLLVSCTSSLVALFRTVERARAGLSEDWLRVGNHDIAYLEGGTGETILLIHGFGANKDNWTRFSRYLTDRYHVLAVDVPGFGDSSKYSDEKYDIDTQVNRLHAFLAAKGIAKAHVTGNSMGGYIAGVYAARYPREVLSLGLLDPAGILGPRLSPVMLEIRKGHNPLVAGNAAQYDEMLKIMFVEPPRIPGFVKAYLAEKAVASRAMNEVIFDQIKSTFLLGERMKDIDARTLIIWGDADRVLDISAAPVLEKGIRDARLVVMKDCGHVPMVERPEETANHYLEFLGK